MRDTIFTQWEPPPKAKPPRARRTAAPRRALPRSPGLKCETCTIRNATQVPPHFPPTMKIAVIGLGPGEIEEQQGIPFVGPTGDVLRTTLKDVGLDPHEDVGYANLSWCRPVDNNFESTEWKKVESQCWLRTLDALKSWTGPLLLLGSHPAQRFLGKSDLRITAARGLWQQSILNTPAFLALHPAAIFHQHSALRRQQMLHQFKVDLQRMANRVLEKEQFPPVSVEMFATLRQATPFLKRLSQRKQPWFFDIETYDAQGSPARKGIATDPFHPDFRVRGVAIALSGAQGVWIELTPAEDEKIKQRPWLSQAFQSPAEKGAFVGGFDENGLVVPGWVEEVRFRVRDPWLAAIALDASSGGHSLERLAVEVLGEPQPKAGIDRSRIADLSILDVARYAVNDACCEYRLDIALNDRLHHGQYL